MQGSSPHDDSARWLVTLFVSLFAGGVGWLVKHLTTRKSEFVQLGLLQAQTDVQVATAEGIRHATVREDESAAVSNLNIALQALKDSVGGLRDERDYWKARAEKAERRPLEEELKRLPETPDGR